MPVISVVNIILLQSKEHSAYVVYTKFQSHEPEFDYLKSVDIEEKINDIQWVRNSRSSHLLLSTNGEIILVSFP